MPTIRFDGTQLRDWDSFHQVFSDELGFPDFYGRNMNAWIDCMSSLDIDDGMSTVHGTSSDPVVLSLDHADAVPDEISHALVESAGFVNWRRLEAAEPAILLLAFHRTRSQSGERSSCQATAR